MADIMIDNWTLQRAAISINDTYEKISSPNEEYVKLIEALVLWDHVYFIDNEYSQYWKKFLYRFGYEKYIQKILDAGIYIVRIAGNYIELRFAQVIKKPLGFMPVS